MKIGIDIDNTITSIEDQLTNAAIRVCKKNKIIYDIINL